MKSVYYNNLGSNKRIYDTIFQCIEQRKKGFPNLGTQNITEIVSEVLNDHPEIFYVSPIIQGIRSILGSYLALNYIYSEEEIIRNRRLLEEETKRIIRENINEHQSDYDKVRVLHDYLKCNLEYDYIAASSSEIQKLEILEAHNIVGALLKKKCVCDGFAKAFKFLCDKIDLECWVVVGTGNSSVESGPHAWNIVRINGYYHHVDVTWDNQYADSSEIPNYGYLNLSDEEISKDHIWLKKNYPQCPNSPYNYFRVNNALIDSKAQLENMLYNNIQMEEEIVMFRIVRDSILEKEINSCLSGCIISASERSKYVSVAEYRLSSIPEQLTFILLFKYIYK